VNRPAPARLIFVTGTDTGVGKTVLTVALLHYLRRQGVPALAMKPFCTGDRRDVRALASLQLGGLSRDQINPFFFPEPVAPLVAARKQGRYIPLAAALNAIRVMTPRCPFLLVEGAGGLLAPLGQSPPEGRAGIRGRKALFASVYPGSRRGQGRGFSALELIRALHAEVLVAAANRLGVINHARLTLLQLQIAGVKKVKFVLVDTVSAQQRAADPSTAANANFLAELLRPVPVLRLPFLGRNPARISVLEKNEKKLKKVLAGILA
jgi:dethiobiotin synthetase